MFILQMNYLYIYILSVADNNIEVNLKTYFKK